MLSYCGAATDGLGFFSIQAARPYHIVQNTHANVSALITVDEGTVLADLLRSELARIIPVQWDWAVQEHGDNSYLVLFPSKEELERMVVIQPLQKTKRVF